MQTRGHKVNVSKLPEEHGGNYKVGLKIISNSVSSHADEQSSILKPGCINIIFKVFAKCEYC